MKKLLYTSTLLISLNSLAFAEIISKVEILGNKRIDNETVKMHINIKEGDNVSQLHIDDALKKLYATGLFKDIKIEHEKGKLKVLLKENPMIYTVALEGNKRVKTEDIIPELSLTQRSILNKNKVQSDVSTIQRIYQKNGRYAVSVSPKIIELPQNRVNLVYEINEGPKTLIGKVVFLGNQNVSAGKLKDIINSKEAKWFRYLSKSPNFDIDKLSYDKELITRFYLSRGYADVTVKEPVVELDTDKNYFVLTFVINEGKVYKFGDIALESEIKNVNLDDLKKLIKTKENATFDNTKIEDTVKSINEYMGDKGYAFIDVDPEANKEEDRVSLKYNIKKAPKYYVNKINIKGNIRTYDKVIRREFKVSEGDAYKVSEINNADKRLRDLDYFETVNIDVEPSTEFEDKIDINVDVKEKSTGFMNLAVGYSDGAGPIAKIAFRESNFAGRGQDVSLSVQKAKRTTEFSANFVEPYFMDNDFSLGLDFENVYFDKTRDSHADRAFSRKSYGFGTAIGYDLTDNLKHSVFYKIRKDRITDLSEEASILLKEQAGTNVLSLIGHSFNYSTLDSKQYPTKGLNVVLTQEFAGVGGDSSFLRHEIRSSYYVPVYKEDVVLSFHGNSGIVNTVNSKKIMLAERFFINGNDLRGFRDYGVGPRDKRTLEALGGNFYYTGRVQLSVPLGLPKELDMKGLFFTDFGSLKGLDYKNYTNITKSGVYDRGNIRASYGTGVAWDSPVGMIGFSYAVPFKKAPFDKEKKFRINIMSEF
ncbi:MAG: outer membrane protein assembly factor BamA [Sphingobacteriia bacterium]|nr:outer membrane protein assembly factor BamA [Sphingobacteriia bacterium]